jgi:hypothetical protein
MRKVDRTVARAVPALPGGQRMSEDVRAWFIFSAQLMEVAHPFTIFSGSLRVFLTHDLGGQENSD